MCINKGMILSINRHCSITPPVFYSRIAAQEKYDIIFYPYLVTQQYLRTSREYGSQTTLINDSIVFRRFNTGVGNKISPEILTRNIYKDRINLYIMAYFKFGHR